ncbi:hypothetical protein A4X13_0g9543 [Tilletia indica]|uniref:Uncharacterized protein n=1 Tax=Tilletia indica TaxID=43049 RepID=A0A8T8S8Y9_9BASI|nr:hypothetical protein A4X13_0g9543 [Tilletia indica]
MTCIANCSGATLLSRHWTRSLRPQTQHIHRLHDAHLTRMYAHRIPPTTHPPMTNFTLSPSKYRQSQEGRRVVIDPMPPIATALSTGCLGQTAYQVRLPTNA